MRKHDTGAHPNDQYAGSGQDDGPVRFTFGKYKGRLIGDTPTDYLTWVWREALSIDPRIREAIRVELTARLQRDRQGGSHQSAASGSQPQSRTCRLQQLHNAPLEMECDLLPACPCRPSRPRRKPRGDAVG